MTFEEFRLSLNQSDPPLTMTPVLKALWYAGKDDWETAHNIAQDIHSSEGSWIHAYLHRKEGDLGNAGYWYTTAGRKMPTYSLDKEWEEIARELLKNKA
jgi:hypothetical protein